MQSSKAVNQLIVFGEELKKDRLWPKFIKIVEA